MKNESTSLLYSIDEKEEIIIINTFLIDNRNRELNLENLSSINHEELSYDELLTFIDEMREKLPSYKDCVDDLVKQLTHARDKFNEALLPLHISSNYSDSILERYYSKVLYEIAKEEKRELRWNAFNILFFWYYHKKSIKKINNSFNSIERTISDDIIIDPKNKNDNGSAPRKRTAVIDYSGQKGLFVYADYSLQNLIYDFYEALSKNKKHICKCSKCHKRFIDDKKSTICDSCSCTTETINDNKCEISSPALDTKVKKDDKDLTPAELKKRILGYLRKMKWDAIKEVKNDEIAVESIIQKHKELKNTVDNTFKEYKKERITAVDNEMIKFKESIIDAMKRFIETNKRTYDRRQHNKEKSIRL